MSDCSLSIESLTSTSSLDITSTPHPYLLDQAWMPFTTVTEPVLILILSVNTTVQVEVLLLDPFPLHTPIWAIRLIYLQVAPITSTFLTKFVRLSMRSHLPVWSRETPVLTTSQFMSMYPEAPQDTALITQPGTVQLPMESCNSGFSFKWTMIQAVQIHIHIPEKLVSSLRKLHRLVTHLDSIPSPVYLLMSCQKHSRIRRTSRAIAGLSVGGMILMGTKMVINALGRFPQPKNRSQPVSDPLFTHPHLHQPAFLCLRLLGYCKVNGPTMLIAVPILVFANA